MGGLSNGPITNPPKPPKPVVEKSPVEIAAKRLETDHIRQRGANRNPWAGYRMSSSRSSRTPKRGVINRRPQPKLGWHAPAVAAVVSCKDAPD